jgi:Asp-tRNA(Asn)/Glu-tRNA(Gln) amidotransferase A subunit family amidase
MSKGTGEGDTKVKDCDRREFVRALGAGTAALAAGTATLGVGAFAPGVSAAAPAALFPGVLWAKAQEADEITPGMILDAARIAGLEVTPGQAEAMVREVQDNLETYQELHTRELGNEVPLPLHFDPRVPGVTVDIPSEPIRTRSVDVQRPSDLETVAFWPITHLARLLETRQVTAVELTEMYLRRLKRYNPTLNCVVNLTEERARGAAAGADDEIAAGEYRGPLHGIPYGVKDIIAARGYPTTWGTPPFVDQVIDEDATVVQRLDEAGAILVAKLTTGELAFGDRWFGGRTNSPWDPEVGSSGSSAGSGAATAAGLVGFSIGTDTGGSILAPSERCGVVGLRPTFGRVSRHGIMAAGTTLDKVGPMCRSAEGAAIVLHAMAGPDHRDFSVPDIPVQWDADLDRLRLGFLANAFEAEEDADYRAEHTRVLGILRRQWPDLTAVELPASNLNFFIEYVERAAGFDGFLREGLDAQLVRPQHGIELRANHLVPTVAYLQANRARQRLMEETHEAMNDVDVVVSPYGVWWDPRRSLNPLTSLTGHPVVAVPTGLRSNGQPLAVLLAGRLYREGELLAVAQHLLEATGFPGERPPLFV